MALCPVGSVCFRLASRRDRRQEIEVIHGRLSKENALRRKTKNSPVVEGILQRRRASEAKERRRQEAAAYRSPEQLAELAERKRLEAVAEQERAASRAARIRELAAEVIELLEEFGYPDAEFVELTEYVFFGFVRRSYRVAAWHLSGEQKHKAHATRVMGDDSGDWRITHIESTEKSLYLLDDGRIVTLTHLSESAPAESLFEPGEEKTNRLYARCLKGLNTRDGRNCQLFTPTVLEAFKDLLVEKHGWKRRNR